MHLLWGGTPENGVTAQEDTAAETIPFEGTTITKGGNYEIPEGTYTGPIVINVTDTTQPVNIAIKGKVTAQCDPFFNIIKAGIVNIENEGNYEVDCTTRPSHFMYISYSGAQVKVTNGKYKGSGVIHLMMNFSGSLTLNNITAQTESSYAITSAGTVIINGGTYTRSGPISSSIENGAIGNGGGTMELHDVTVNSCQVAVTNSNGELTIDGGNYTSDNGFNCIRNESAGLKIDRGAFDLSYQNKLKLFSMNSGYIIGYKRGADGKEYRYLADANGSIVNAVNAKATADLGAGEQELDTATVVPKGTTVTVTANIPEGAEFLGWSAVRADGIALNLGDDQTEHFEMPGCNVTVEALYQGGNVDPVNPGGGSSDVVAGIAAVALTGAAVWGIYETGTGIYRVLNMPGVPMPSNRAGLATLIWEKAGCPEPQTVKSFSDIDDADLHLRQAASWMEEQGLMDDVKENEFRPYRYVTKLQTCLVWDKAKEENLIS